MKNQRSRSPNAGGGMATVALAGLLACGAGGFLTVSGCESDDVGHHKTVTKETVETPTEKKTITETHEKDTRYVPK